MSTLSPIAEEFMNNAKSIHDEYNRNILPTNNLYHYTNFNGLKSILENHEVWYTDYRYLNDPTEILITNNLIKGVVNNFLSKSNFKFFWQEFNRIYPSHIEKSSTYIFSLCKEGDYLPAWRWYGDNGSGFSIGFHPNYFKPVGEGTKNTNPVVFLKINYDIKNFSSLIEDFLKLAEDTCTKNSASVLDRDFNIHLGGALSANLLPLMPGFKHEGYKYEIEYRLYQFEFKSNNDIFTIEIPSARKFSTPKSLKAINSNPCTRVSDNTEVPRIQSEKFNNNDISEIWVGPCCDFECAKREIYNILDSSGYEKNKITIKQSEQPYRS